MSGVWTSGSSYARLFTNDGTRRFAEATAASGLGPPSQDVTAARRGGPSSRSGPITAWASPPPTTTTTAGPTSSSRRSGRTGCSATRGDGTFADVTGAAGLGDRRAFSTSAMWFDYDRDGQLDLLICNYVQWTPQTDVFCSADGKPKRYCTPEAYRGSTSWLYRNKGDGTFEDVTATAGLFDVTSKSLGVTLLDYDHDGWPDVFVANDTQPNKLYRNNGNGTFTELGLQGRRGVQRGRPRPRRHGRRRGRSRQLRACRRWPSPTSPARCSACSAPVGDGQYVDRAPGSDIGRATRQTLGWGCFFFDVDLDGLQDLLVVNGAHRRRARRHGAPAGVRGRDAAPVPQPRRARSPTSPRDAGATFAQPKVGRGAAFGDIDDDGDLDVVITTNGGPRAPLPHRSAGRQPQRCA